MLLVILTIIVLAFIFGGPILGIAAILIALGLEHAALEANSKRSDAIYHANHPNGDDDIFIP